MRLPVSVFLSRWKNSLWIQGIVHPNGSGSLYLDLLSSATDATQIVNAILNEYDVDEATAMEDVQSFPQKLTETEII